jgi:hypothetical protein
MENFQIELTDTGATRSMPGSRPHCPNPGAAQFVQAGWVQSSTRQGVDRGKSALGMFNEQIGQVVMRVTRVAGHVARIGICHPKIQRAGRKQDRLDV